MYIYVYEIHAHVQGQKKQWVRDRPLSKWVFFHPARITEVDAWIKANANVGGLSQGSTRFHLNTDQIVKLQAHIGTDNDGESYVRTVYQFHGERMYVPAGWAHQVENLQECVKLAWDFFASPAKLPLSLVAWQHVHARIAGISAKDYLYAAAVTCKAVDMLPE